MTVLPESMKAIEIVQPGGPEVLQPTERPVPKPGIGEVLIRVASAGVNRPDVLQRQGNYAPPPGATDIPGLELSGEVVAIGEGVETREQRNILRQLGCEFGQGYLYGRPRP